MKNLYTERMTIDDTIIDFEMKVPVMEIMRLLEIASFNHADKIGLDHDTMQEKSNAFWIVSKIKLQIRGDILSQDKISINTWTHTPSLIRCDRDCEIKRKSKVLIRSTSEWCCLDFDTRRVRKMSTITYPDLEMVRTDGVELSYSNMRCEVNDSDLVYSREIRATDIDVNNHTNNLKYNYIAMDSFSMEELRAIKITEYEIYFVNESHFGDRIDVYKKRADKDHYYIEGRIADRTVFRVIIKYKKKKN